jgi:superfamily II DNA or RNA helicase
MLSDLDLPAFLDTSSADLIEDLFVPALTGSVFYDRGVGFFSSGWLRIASKGMLAFANNGGRARWVTSPILDSSDWDALQTGDAAKHDLLLYEAIKHGITSLEQALERDVLSALAWMVADEVISFKLALPRNKLERGDFHDKFGVFTDHTGNKISFNGSYNDSIQGTRNYESIKVFCSWQPPFDRFVKADDERFERLWANADPNVRVYDLPEAALEQILSLRSSDRPYKPPPGSNLNSLLGSIDALQDPAIPGSLVLRDYQLKAVDAWFENGCCGLLEMATGTGKTITALAAAVRLRCRDRKLALIIAVPYQHLVDQWYDEAIRFGFRPIRAYKNKSDWLDKLHDQALSYAHDDYSHMCVICTHTTFATSHFQDAIARIPEPKMLIADEVHHLGAESSRKFLPEGISNRLALSATPDRWFDDIGTQALRDYFGQTVFALPLKDAIGLSLTPYYYYPTLIDLTEEEMEEYRSLSLSIARVLARDGFDGSDSRLTALLIKRSNLLNSAENKLDMVDKLVNRPLKMHHALFYCAPCQVDDLIQLLGNDKRMAVHRFTAKEDTQTRQELLHDFDSGRLQALVAIHCLDEGVDVPATRTAFLLASSGNPREFIQRRGRVLRRFPGKNHADIHDLISIPPASRLDPTSLNAERSILKRELKRFAEFADSALNTASAYQVIWDIAKQYGVLDF